MSEFDEWFKVEMPNSHKKVNKERMETVIYSCAEASWNHQQAKIDELQGRIDEALTLIYKEKSKVECDVYKGLDADLIIGVGYELHLILKGNKDEN